MGGPSLRLLQGWVLLFVLVSDPRCYFLVSRVLPLPRHATPHHQEIHAAQHLKNKKNAKGGPSLRPLQSCFWLSPDTASILSPSNSGSTDSRRAGAVERGNV